MSTTASQDSVASSYGRVNATAICKALRFDGVSNEYGGNFGQLCRYPGTRWGMPNHAGGSLHAFGTTVSWRCSGPGHGRVPPPASTGVMLCASICLGKAGLECRSEPGWFSMIRGPTAAQAQPQTRAGLPPRPMPRPGTWLTPLLRPRPATPAAAREQATAAFYLTKKVNAKNTVRARAADAGNNASRGRGGDGGDDVDRDGCFGGARDVIKARSCPLVPGLGNHNRAHVTVEGPFQPTRFRYEKPPYTGSLGCATDKYFRRACHRRALCLPLRALAPFSARSAETRPSLLSPSFHPCRIECVDSAYRAHHSPQDGHPRRRRLSALVARVQLRGGTELVLPMESRHQRRPIQGRFVHAAVPQRALPRLSVRRLPLWTATALIQCHCLPLREVTPSIGIYASPHPRTPATPPLVDLLLALPPLSAANLVIPYTTRHREPAAMIVSGYDYHRGGAEGWTRLGFGLAVHLHQERFGTRSAAATVWRILGRSKLNASGLGASTNGHATRALELIIADSSDPDELPLPFEAADATSRDASRRNASRITYICAFHERLFCRCVGTLHLGRRYLETGRRRSGTQITTLAVMQGFPTASKESWGEVLGCNEVRAPALSQLSRPKHRRLTTPSLLTRFLPRSLLAYL